MSLLPCPHPQSCLPSHWSGFFPILQQHLLPSNELAWAAWWDVRGSPVLSCSPSCSPAGPSSARGSRRPRTHSTRFCCKPVNCSGCASCAGRSCMPVTDSAHPPLIRRLTPPHANWVGVCAAELGENLGFAHCFCTGSVATLSWRGGGSWDSPSGPRQRSLPGVCAEGVCQRPGGCTTVSSLVSQRVPC